MAESFKFNHPKASYQIIETWNSKQGDFTRQNKRFHSPDVQYLMTEN